MATHQCNQVESISTLKANQLNMADNIAEIKNDIKDIKKYIMEDLDKKYASKLSEVIVYAMCACILIAFLTFIIPWK